VTPPLFDARVSVERPTFRTLLVALNRHDADAPAQNRGQLVFAELVKGAVVVDLSGTSLSRWTGKGTPGPRKPAA
jgi:hypothetical protein